MRRSQDARSELGTACSSPSTRTNEPVRSCKCSQGKHFCAGANFANRSGPFQPEILYRQVAKLFSTAIPIVAAVEGATIGGGLGLALVA